MHTSADFCSTLTWLSVHLDPAYYDPPIVTASHLFARHRSVLVIYKIDGMLSAVTCRRIALRYCCSASPGYRPHRCQLAVPAPFLLILTSPFHHHRTIPKSRPHRPVEPRFRLGVNKLLEEVRLSDDELKRPTVATIWGNAPGKTLSLLRSYLLIALLVMKTLPKRWWTDLWTPSGLALST